MADNSAAINTNAQKPKRVEQDGTVVEQHSIPDQIAADRYAASKAAGNAARRLGLRFFKIVSPGAVAR